MNRVMIWSSLSIGLHFALLLWFPVPPPPAADADALTMVFTVAAQTGDLEEVAEQTLAAAEGPPPEPEAAEPSAPPVPPAPEIVAAPAPVPDELVPQPREEPEPIAAEEPAPEERVVAIEPAEPPLPEPPREAEPQPQPVAPVTAANAVDPRAPALGPETDRTDEDEPEVRSVPAGPADAVGSADTGPTGPEAAQPEKKTAETVPPSLLSGAKPRYPRVARRRGWEGVVLLRVFVTTEGEIREVQLEESSGHDALDRAALKSIQSWLFHPAQRGRTPVAGELLVPIRFDLVKAG